MEPTTMKFKVESFRKIPNPYKEDANKIPEMYVAICDVKNIPDNIPMETNPRKQNLKNGVSKKIKRSLVEEMDFHLLNRGLLISAKEVSFNNYDSTMTVVFEDSECHGDVDGGHTYQIILNNRDDLEFEKQFVKLEILTGVESMFQDLADARNTSTQVQDKSIAELKDYFELIKETIGTEEFSNRVYYMENDDGDIDVGDILAILNLFNIDRYNGMDSFPVVSFSSRKRCIDQYIEMYVKYGNGPANPYVKMKPIMIDIFKLYDKLEHCMAEYYRTKVTSGKFGAITGVNNAKPGKSFLSKFYLKELQHSSPNGFLFPILGSLRALVKEENGKYTWGGKNPFELLDAVGPELVFTTVERSRTLGNNPPQVGKDSGNWQTLFMRVVFQCMNS